MYISIFVIVFVRDHGVFDFCRHFDGRQTHKGAIHFVKGVSCDLSSLRYITRSLIKTITVSVVMAECIQTQSGEPQGSQEGKLLK